MKCLVAAVLAALSIASPAHAAPQWVRVSQDGKVFANFNTARGSDNTRSVDVSMETDSFGILSGTMHIDCAAWRYATTFEGNTRPWEPIGRLSVSESVARLVCPDTTQQATPVNSFN
jgi:hypothetical protein